MPLSKNCATVTMSKERCFTELVYGGDREVESLCYRREVNSLDNLPTSIAVSGPKARYCMAFPSHITICEDLND